MLKCVSWVAVWVLTMCLTRETCASEVRVTSDGFVRSEVTRLVGELDRERLVSFTRGKALTLRSPSAGVLQSFSALEEAVVPLLVEAFPKVSDGARYGITKVLLERGESGKKALVEMLRRRNLGGRRWILLAMQGTYSAGILAAYRDLALDPDLDVAETVIQELGESEDDVGVRVLRKLLRSPEDRRAQAAALALAFEKDATGVGILLDVIRGRRRSSGPMYRFKVIQALGACGGFEATDYMVDAFAGVARRISASEPPLATQNLGQLMVSARPLTEAQMAMLEASFLTSALASGGSRRPRPQIVPFLAHSNPQVRRMSLEILGACADASAVSVLAGFLQRLEGDRAKGSLADAFSGLTGSEEPEREVVAAAQALRQIGDPRALEPLVKVARWAPYHVKSWIQICLAALDHPQGVERAVELAKGSDPDLKVAAISALGLSHHRLALSFLCSLLSSSDGPLRLLAASSLSRPGNPAAQEPLISFLEQSRKIGDRQGLVVASLGLGIVGDDRAVKPLANLLKNPDPSVRRSSAIGLYYLTGDCVVYLDPWEVSSRFQPTTFHERLRAERVGKLDAATHAPLRQGSGSIKR